jgi:two-component system sensor histidine kinase DegS
LNNSISGHGISQRVVAELNDGLAQWMVSAAYEIDYCQSLLAGGQSDEADEALQKVRDILQMCLVELRQTISELQPLPITELGLIGAINHRARQMKTYGIDATVTVGKNIPKLTVVEENAVFGIVEEALSNIRRHAGADSAEVNIGSTEDIFIISISDNGCGFEVPDSGSPGSRGLASMKELADSLNGDLTIVRNRGQGTKITLSFRVSSPMLKFGGGSK